jgi:threonine/homoserine/homoserine lactone efflux protein
MLLLALLNGMAIGFFIAAPVGPIGILCIKRTLSQGRLYGFLSGLGAATADAIYGCIAGFGLTIISNFLVDQSSWLQFIGGLFLCYLGVRTFVSTPPQATLSNLAGSKFGSYISTFLLTITNPVTILSFLAVFSGLGLSDSDYTIFSRLLVVIGVFLGSLLWWGMLSSGISLIRDYIERKNFLPWINRLSGIILFVFGCTAVLFS